MCCCFALLVGQINAINGRRAAGYKSVSRPVARGVQMDAMHPLQIWLNPLWICKISKTDTPISLLKNL